MEDHLFYFFTEKTEYIGPMQFEKPLIRGVFLKRYKRFFADVRLDTELADSAGDTVVAHVANTGSMKSCVYPDSPCLLSKNDDPARKLKFTLQAVLAPSGHWVGINTSLPNKLVLEAYQNGLIQDWLEFDIVKPEFKLSAETRLDFLFTNSKTGLKKFVEVKNVTMAEGDISNKKGRALFPDSETTRGQKHLQTLTDLVKQGHQAEIVFTVQRSDCDHFSIAKDIDAEYADLFLKARTAGVKVRVLLVDIDHTQIKIIGKEINIV